MRTCDTIAGFTLIFKSLTIHASNLPCALPVKQSQRAVDSCDPVFTDNPSQSSAGTRFGNDYREAGRFCHGATGPFTVGEFINAEKTRIPL
jgi:hypothetical protein